MVVAVEDYEIAYVPVPKAACTSVKAMLVQMKHPGRRDVTQKEAHDVFPTRRFRAQRFDDHAGFFRFTVVRDPIRRLLSVYTDRVVKRDELKNSPRLRRVADLPTDPDPDFFFQNLEAYKSLSSVIKHHAMKQMVFTGENLRGYDRIYTTAQLPRLRADLAAMTGRVLDLPHANSSTRRIDYDDLAPATRAALRAHTEAEYRLFGGLFTPPWAQDLSRIAG